nr:hypothetical protein [Maliibacterium massiliense]
MWWSWIRDVVALGVLAAWVDMAAPPGRIRKVVMYVLGVAIAAAIITPLGDMIGRLDNIDDTQAAAVYAEGGAQRASLVVSPKEKTQFENTVAYQVARWLEAQTGEEGFVVHVMAKTGENGVLQVMDIEVLYPMLPAEPLEASAVKIKREKAAGSIKNTLSRIYNIETQHIVFM